MESGANPPIKVHSDLTWTLAKPTEPGWYWAMNEHEIPRMTWQAIVRVERMPGGLFCFWLNKPGSCKSLHESEWG